MDFPTDGSGAANHNDVFEALANRRRRTVLSVLRRVDRARPDELATHLLAEETGASPTDVEQPAAERAELALEHRHLPRLADAGLVTREDGIVRTTGHPTFEDPDIDELVDVDADDWDDVLECLADGRRRAALRALHRSDVPMDRDDLAASVAEAVRDDVDAADVLVGLHHVHLPRLAGAGLVAYDADAGAVAYEGHPDFDEKWLAVGPTDAPRVVPDG